MKIKIGKLTIEGIEISLDVDEIYNLPNLMSADALKTLIAVGLSSLEESEVVESEDNQEDNDKVEVKGFNGEN